MINVLSSFLYGLLAAFALILGSYLLWKQAKKEDLQVDLIFDWMLILAISAIVIGRIFFILEHFGVFSQDIFRWIHFIRYPGISSKGAFYGGLLAGVLYLRKRKVNVYQYLDILVLPLLYINLLTSLGCVINNCAIEAKPFPTFGLKLPIIFLNHPISLYFVLFSLVLIFTFKKIKKKKVLDAEKAAQGIYFLLFVSLFSLFNLILEYFFLNALYLKNFNIRLGFNIFTFVISFSLLIGRVGVKKIINLLFIKYFKKQEQKNV